jgi:hypothetical protein
MFVATLLVSSTSFDYRVCIVLSVIFCFIIKAGRGAPMGILHIEAIVVGPLCHEQDY